MDTNEALINELRELRADILLVACTLKGCSGPWETTPTPDELRQRLLRSLRANEKIWDGSLFRGEKVFGHDLFTPVAHSDPKP